MTGMLIIYVRKPLKVFLKKIVFDIDFVSIHVCMLWRNLMLYTLLFTVRFTPHSNIPTLCSVRSWSRVQKNLWSWRRNKAYKSCIFLINYHRPMHATENVYYFYSLYETMQYQYKTRSTGTNVIKFDWAFMSRWRGRVFHVFFLKK